MKLRQVRVVIREKLNVGNFENIEPEVEFVGELEDGDDPAGCATTLHKIAETAWARNALKELAWVALRRKSDKKKFSEYTEETKDTRAQIKTLI